MAAICFTKTLHDVYADKVGKFILALIIPPGIIHSRDENAIFRLKKDLGLVTFCIFMHF